MPITIDLHDDLVQRLQRQAEARQVSLQEWVIQLLNRSQQFPDRPEAWRQLNARRFQLIHQRHQGGLTAAEEAELAELQATADQWLEPLDRSSEKKLECPRFHPLHLVRFGLQTCLPEKAKYPNHEPRPF